MPPPRAPRFPARRLVELIHLDQIRHHGGAPGLRDEGLLESALDRPRMRHTYDVEADLADLSGSLAFGLAKNHPFVDGNKRVAFATLITMLGMNDAELTATEQEAVEVMLAVASSSMDEVTFAGWIRDHSQKRSSRARGKT